MTDVAVTRPVFVPSGRPVRRFVVAQLLLALLFGALWWSGLTAPRLNASTESTTYDERNGVVTARVRVFNNAPLTEEVRSVAVGDEPAMLESVRVDGRDSAGGARRIAGGGAASMIVEFPCRFDDDAFQPLRLTVRTPIGVNRTRVVGTVQLPPECAP